ncbi:MAG: YvcK family protein [Bacilli bacterium]|nr:YvcK family protein [Bacilli bacterium]
MRKKVVVLGGGTGMSSLLKGLKEFPVDITAVVSVCDDGRSTGRLREEFHVPAMGDIRQVLVSLSETEPLVEELLNYRFKTTSDLNGHPVGNLLLTAVSNMTGNMSSGVASLGKVFNLKGKILPLTDDDVVLVAKMEDGSIIEGEHNITEYDSKIMNVYYKEEPHVNEDVIKSIKEADLVILSMGSIYTSILPNLICKEVVDVLEKTSVPIMYTCNIMTQPGETDDLSVSEHLNIINKYLGNRKVDVVVANNGVIKEEMRKKYETLEQKDPVLLDSKNLSDVKVISNDYVTIEKGFLRHDTILLSLDIFKYLITNEKS